MAGLSQLSRSSAIRWHWAPCAMTSFPSTSGGTTTSNFSCSKRATPRQPRPSPSNGGTRKRRSRTNPTQSCSLFTSGLPGVRSGELPSTTSTGLIVPRTSPSALRRRTAGEGIRDRNLPPGARLRVHPPWTPQHHALGLQLQRAGDTHLSEGRLPGDRMPSRGRPCGQPSL